MKRLSALISLLSIAAISQVQAVTFLVDLNTNSPDNSSRPAGTWNQYAAPANIDGGFLQNSAGGASTVTFSQTGTITDNTNNSGTAVYDPSTTTNPSWVAAVGANGASGDNFFTSNADNSTAHTFTLTFGGLAAGSQLSFDLLAARNSGSARGLFDYSVDNGVTWKGFTVFEANGTPSDQAGWDMNTTASQIFNLQTQGFTAHRYMHMTDSLAPAVTNLLIRTTDDTSSNGLFSAMNAMRLTVIPEPSGAMMLGLGILGLAARRRRC